MRIAMSEPLISEKRQQGTGSSSVVGSTITISRPDQRCCQAIWEAGAALHEPDWLAGVSRQSSVTTEAVERVSTLLEGPLIALTIHHETTYRDNQPVRLNAHRLMLRPRESRELPTASCGFDRDA